MSSESIPPYPSTCPSCGKQDGYPKGATVGSTHGSIVVDLRCGTCAATWTENLPKSKTAHAGGKLAATD